MSEIEAEKAAVILLSRPGTARDKLRAAICNAGGEVALEAAPRDAVPDALLALSPAAVVLALDEGDESVLDTLLMPLSDAGVVLLLEEAEVAASREGWDAQRWERHLAAKLQGHRNVLPPGAEDDGLPQDAWEPPRPGMTPLELEDIGAAAFVLEGDGLPLEGAGLVSDSSGGEMRLEVPHPDVALDFSGGALRLTESVPAMGVSLVSTADAPAQGVDGFEWQDLGQGDDSLAWEPPAAATQEEVQGLDFLPPLEEIEGQDAAAADLPRVHGDLGLADTHGEDAVQATGPSRAMPPPLPPPVAVPPPSQWSLLALDDLPPAPPPVSPARVAAENWKLDGLALTPIDGEEMPAQAGVAPVFADDLGPPKGLGVLLAGIGGPDAIRRLLGALPEQGMPGAVLVQLKLEGGRHSNLVNQLSRFCPPPLFLAQPGEVLGAGRVYVLDDTTIVKSTGNVLRFAQATAGESLLDTLPPRAAGVVMLSGADPVLVPTVLALQARGVWVAGQSGEGCYDPAAASLLAVEGMPLGEPAWLASGLMALWQ